jgi:hypothetical protein
MSDCTPAAVDKINDDDDDPSPGAATIGQTVACVPSGLSIALPQRDLNSAHSQSLY